MFTLTATIMAGFLLAANPADTAQEKLRQNYDTALGMHADTIEVVYADGAYSHLEYGSTAPSHSEPYRPNGPFHWIESPRLLPFGDCIPIKGGISRNSGRPCGLLMDLSVGKSPLDLLDFDSLDLSGTITGSWRVAIADEFLAGIESNYPIGELRNKGPATFPLSRAASHIDLKRSKVLAFILTSPKGSLNFNRIGFGRPNALPSRPSRPALWMWKNRKAQESPAAVASDLEQKKIRRVYLQICDNLEPFRPFLRECKSRGIEVYALDGGPEYVKHPDPLLNRARLVREFNSRVPESPFNGFQIDVEPHLNRDFRLRFNEYGHRYTELLDRLKEELGDGIPLSTVIPFWYDTLLLDKRSLAWHLISRSSETVIMSYRTDIREVEKIAKEELAYGERMGKPILLGIETVRIPDELHISYRRCAQDASHAVVIGNKGWCRGIDYAVPGSRLSFHGQTQAFREHLNRSIPSPAFAGWVIHSYESYPR